MSLFSEVNKKQIKLKEEKQVTNEDLKDLATYAGIIAGATGAIVTDHIDNDINKNQSIERIEKAQANLPDYSKYEKIGKIVDAKVNVKDKTITYIDEHGNKLIKQGGNISQLTNNPGNILIPRKGFGPKNWQKLQDMGAISYYKTKRNVYAVFPTEKTGWDAVVDWWKNPARKEWTIEKAMHVYAPQTENNTENYIAYLTSDGISRKDKLKNLSDTQIQDIVGMIRNMEGTEKSKETFVPAVKPQKVSMQQAKNEMILSKILEKMKSNDIKIAKISPNNNKIKISQKIKIYDNDEAIILPLSALKNFIKDDIYNSGYYANINSEYCIYSLTNNNQNPLLKEIKWNKI